MSSAPRSSRSVINATINCWEIVLSKPIGSGNVSVRVLLEFDRHKLVPENLIHGCQNSFAKRVRTDVAAVAPACRASAATRAAGSTCRPIFLASTLRWRSTRASRDVPDQRSQRDAIVDRARLGQGQDTV